MRIQKLENEVAQSISRTVQMESEVNRLTRMLLSRKRRKLAQLSSTSPSPRAQSGKAQRSAVQHIEQKLKNRDSRDTTMLISEMEQTNPNQKAAGQWFEHLRP